MASSETAAVRNSTLNRALWEFVVDAAGELAGELEAGAEIPFELADAGRRSQRTALYCYRPMPDLFIGEREELLGALPSRVAAIHAMAAEDGIANYLEERGLAPVPADRRERAELALRELLARVFDQRSDFSLDRARFEVAFEELERAVYEGRRVATVIAPLLGVVLDPQTSELALGDGLSLVRGDSFDEAPGDAFRMSLGGDGPEAPKVLAVLRDDVGERPPAVLARARFGRLLTALRLFEGGRYAFGPVWWVRADQGVWRPVPQSSAARSSAPVTAISAAQQDELRAFCNLVARRVPATGEIGWALSRYELGCERTTWLEALSDFLLALRALLEPEGPHSARLAGRLAVLCAQVDDRAGVAERLGDAIVLEREAIAGRIPAPMSASGLVEELSQHLRALLRDVVCGHLDAGLVSLADDLLAQAAAELPGEAPPGEATVCEYEGTTPADPAEASTDEHLPVPR